MTEADFDVRKLKHMLDAAAEEINLVLVSHKSKEVKRQYLRNALYFVNEVRHSLTSVIMAEHIVGIYDQLNTRCLLWRWLRA